MSTSKILLDDWQIKVLQTKGNRCICSGRQVGKSTIISQDAGEYAVKNPKVQIMIISAVERQALLLFEKVLAYIHQNYKTYIAKGKNKPTKHELKLTNGSIIRCLPTGMTGYGIRGYTIDRLYADEAAFIPEDVWAAVIPMLTTTGGDITLLSTPFGRDNYFYRCFHDDKFTSFQISTEEVAKSRTEPQRSRMLQFLEDQKKQMSKMEYQQEFEGLFIDEMMQLFSDDLIKSCAKGQRPKIITPADYFLGIDVAGRGDDDTTYEIIKKSRSGRLVQVENIVKKNNMTTFTTRDILTLNKQYDFKKILIDDGGLGVGVFEQLLEEEETRRKVVPINNASRSLNKDDSRTKRLLKEDLYNNLLRLMERAEITILDDPEIAHSLKSVQYSYEEGKFRIFGKNTHIAEGLIRAAWGAKGKNLNPWIISFKP